MENRSSNSKMVPLIIVGSLLTAGIAGVVIYYLFCSGDSSSPFKAKGDLPYFNEFKTAFDETMAKKDTYVLSTKQDGVSDDEKKSIKAHDGLKSLLQAINYATLFGGKVTPSPLAKSDTDAIKNFDIKAMKKDDPKAAKEEFNKILADAKVVDELVITMAQIKAVKALDLTNFSFETLPKGLQLFVALEDLNIDAVGLKSLVAIDGVKALKNLSAKDNAITEIPALKDCPALETIHLELNNLTKVDADFKKNHSNLTKVYVKAKPSGKLDASIETLIKDNDGKFEATL